MHSPTIRSGLSVIIAAVLAGACGGGGVDGDTQQDPITVKTTPSEDDTAVVDVRGVKNTYLFLSYTADGTTQDLGESDEIYYGTQNVGVEARYSLRVANRGADIYPLRNISVVGANADEFRTDIVDEIILQPAEFVNIGVSFQPVTEGEKDAEFLVDFDTIQMVDESVNINEQAFYQANELLDDGDFVTARSTFENYLSNDPVTSNKRRAAIRVPVINEAQSYDANKEELGSYLDALRLRDEREYGQAIEQIDTLTTLEPESYLSDDAIYLKAYIQLIDLDQPQDALISINELHERYPDTSYYDTSLYSEAIAQIELDNIDDARRILLNLRQRHTGIDALGIQLPKDNLMSRMWFDRASELLATI